MEGNQMIWRSFVSFAALFLMVGCTSEPAYDVVIYGGTSAGVSAAVQTAQLGKKVILIEPGSYLGGLTSGGLGNRYWKQGCNRRHFAGVLQTGQTSLRS